MTEYVTGQIYGWNGGECPVHPATVVEVWLRSCVGSEVDIADIYLWEHSNTDSDIVCFQVITPHIEPKTIWVNEYADGRGFGYTSEEVAKSLAYPDHKRVAVKYVEEKE